MGKESSPPPAPDYAGAAAASAAGDLKAAQTAAAANRVNQITPYGTLKYTEGGTDSQGNPMWTATTALSPEQQQLLNQQNKTSIGLANLQDQGLGYVQNMLDKPFDTSKLAAEQVNPGETAQDAIMRRLNPQFDRRQAQLEAQMANQGIARGTEAWHNAQTDLDQARNDAMSQAALQGISLGQQARQQGLQEQAFLRSEPLNTLNAVRTGAQVTGPQFVSVPQQATTSGPNMMGAAQAQGQWDMGGQNAEQASNANKTAGIVGLASAAAMAF